VRAIQLNGRRTVSGALRGNVRLQRQLRAAMAVMMRARRGALRSGAQDIFTRSCRMAPEGRARLATLMAAAFAEHARNHARPGETA